MSANLANVYAELLRKYGETYTISYAAPPTYLRNLVGAHEAGKKIVLFYKEDRSAAKSDSLCSPTTLLKNSPKTDLDLTGSPLKDDCIAEAIGDLSLDLNLVTQNPWKLEEEYHRGISVDKARQIFCSENFQHADGEGSVWFLCDGADHQWSQFLQFEFNKTHFSRGIVNYKGITPASTLSTQNLVQQHKQMTILPFETSIENYYQINANMAVRCSWSTPAAQPLLVDLGVGEVLLTQTFRVSDCGPVTEDLLNQLRILAYIREDILRHYKDEQEGLSREPQYRCGRGIDMDELREAIFKTMTEVSGVSETFGSGHAEFDIEEVVQQAKLRKSIDLTDKLWELLKCCSSFKDLKIAFNILFQCAARCNIVNTPTNKNRLAEIISELANRRLAMPCLSGAEPLELLLEIGIEKLYKDYEFIFIESKVCSANLLKNCDDAAEKENKETAGQPEVRKSLHNNARGPTLAGNRKTLLHFSPNKKQSSKDYENEGANGFKNSNFDTTDSLLKVSKLFQIHCTLEHLLMIHINLNLSNVFGDVCKKLLQQPPRLVEAIDDHLTDVMEIGLSPHYVRGYLTGKNPNSRLVTMKSANKFRELKTTFYFNTENVCPPQLAKCFKCDDKELVKEGTYHFWLYRKLSSSQ